MSNIQFPYNPPAEHYTLATPPSQQLQTIKPSSTPSQRPSQQRISRSDRPDNPSDAAYGAPLSSPLLPLLFGILLFYLFKKKKLRHPL